MTIKVKTACGGHICKMMERSSGINLTDPDEVYDAGNIVSEIFKMWMIGRIYNIFMVLWMGTESTHKLKNSTYEGI